LASAVRGDGVLRQGHDPISHGEAILGDVEGTRPHEHLIREDERTPKATVRGVEDGPDPIAIVGGQKAAPVEEGNACGFEVPKEHRVVDMPVCVHLAPMDGQANDDREVGDGGMGVSGDGVPLGGRS